jgi:non-specific serine/threonine protein kinase
MEHSLPLLSGGAHDLPDRLQAMRTTIDWSYELLEPSEQDLFRCVAVFAGGFTLEAAEAVCNRSPEAAVQPDGSASSSVLDDLTALVNKSLVQAQSGPDTGRRFRLLEPIREYALEQLRSNGPEEETRAGHAAWCLRLAETGEAELGGPDEADWMNIFDLEHANLRAALSWSIATQRWESAARICGACSDYWLRRGHCDEARQWLERVSMGSGSLSPRSRARVLLKLGMVSWAQGDYERAMVLDEAVAMFRADGEWAGVAQGLYELARVAQAQGDHSRAVACHEEALVYAQQLGDEILIGANLRSLGLCAYDQGDHERAGTLLGEALELLQAHGAWNQVGSAYNNLALVALARGDSNRATALQQHALYVWSSLGYKGGIAHCLENLAMVAVAQHHVERGAQLFAAAEALRNHIGTPGRLIDRETTQTQIDSLRDRMGKYAFAELWDAGSEMSLDEAIDLAMRSPIPTTPAKRD